MSIWNKLGLPSSKDILQLQEEITALKAENLALHAATVSHITEQETNTQQKVKAHMDKNTTLLQADLTVLRTQSLEQIEQSILLLQALDVQRNSFTKQMTKLNQTHSKMEKLLTELQTEQQVALEPQVAQLRTLVELCNKTAEGISSTQTTLEDLSPMKEYLYSLWEAMKLVWINDLIDLEK